MLGAGLGTRLRPLTNHCPKPLLPVGGRPMITYAMDHLICVGIERFIINTHHCAEAYTQAFSDGQWQGKPVIFRHEPELLDTGGGLKNIEDLLDADETIFVYNGDIMTDIPLQPLIDTHRRSGKEVTLALRTTGSPQNVHLNAQGNICDLRFTLGDPGVRSCLFTGIYIVEKRFLNRMQPGNKDSVIPVFIDMIRETPGSVAGVLIDEGLWYDIGSIEEYHKVCALYAHQIAHGIPSNE